MKDSEITIKEKEEEFERHLREPLCKQKNCLCGGQEMFITMYPTLSKIALCFPITSEPTKKVFSTDGLILYK